MKAARSSRDRVMPLVWASAALSFAFWPVVVWLDFHEPAGAATGIYSPYFEQINWWPYPFFFLALAPGLWLTWTPLLDAWKRLADTDVLQGADGSSPSREAVVELRETLRSYRPVAVVAALLTAIVVNAVDRADVVYVYGGTASLSEQKSYACRELGPFAKWIFDAEGAPELICGEATSGEHAVGGREPGLAPPAGQIVFAGISVLQQFLIVFLAALAVLQVLLHTGLFAVFERLPVARKHGLRLMLNSRSPLNEFGLEHWNYALNNFYWAVCPALLGVFMSRAATPPERYYPGQVVLAILVPVCLIAPMAATILVRQARLPDTWKTLQPNGSVPPEDYRRQQLWPLDRNWTSKLGIVLAFALAALAIGFEVTQLVRL